MTVCGKKEEFAPVRQVGGMTVINYGYREIEGTDLANWEELIFYKMRDGKVTLDMVKSAVWNDINAQTDVKILSGFTWTPENGEPISVWLSEENQRNFSEAQRIAMFMPECILPVTFKLGENADGEPVYHEFTTAAELTQFYLQAVGYINQCLQDGWKQKDSIDWTPYELILNPVTENENAGEE